MAFSVRIPSVSTWVGIALVVGPLLSVLGCSRQDAGTVNRPVQVDGELAPLEEAGLSPYGAVQLSMREASVRKMRTATSLRLSGA